VSVPVVEAIGLAKTFPASGKRRREGRAALQGVDLTVAAGEIVALIGQSGAGKSTLVSLLIGLERPTAGRLSIEGRDLSRAGEEEWRAVRRRVQVVFQDPYDSLDPRQTVEEIVAEALRIHRLGGSAAGRRALVERALADVGLEPARFLARRPAELSGGQRQRVAIAAALVVEPVLLLADEPVSMLDVSVRAEILNLLADLRTRHRLAVLYITHDLATAAAVADRLLVLDGGRVVESGPVRAVFASPGHPTTRELLDALPSLERIGRRARASAGSRTTA
jgi:ABC-type glutathione transport system ATPase component